MIQKIRQSLVSLSVLAASASGRLDIRDFGAVADDDSLAVEQANALAFNATFEAVKNADPDGDREVYVPAGMTFNIMPIWFSYITNLTLTIDGTLKASKNHQDWTLDERGRAANLIDFSYVDGLKI